MWTEFSQHGAYIALGAAVFLALEAGFLALSRKHSFSRKVNNRLKTLEDAESQHDVLVLLRRARGLSAEGHFVLPIIWFNRLTMQSGVGTDMLKTATLIGVPTVLIGGVLIFLEFGILVALASILGATVLLPVLVLYFLRRKRLRRFESQLPDAVDIMVRGLRAGHPLPVSIAMVGREMSDPIGSEFGLTADELTYGLDLETAMANLSARVGQEDLSLLVLAISIQSQTGGNLSEILTKLSSVLRSRSKMRRKVRSVSAEGRASAMILSILPFIVFGALFTTSPNFYGGVWHEPIVAQVLGFAGGLMVVGNLIMFKMVNFRI